MAQVSDTKYHILVLGTSSCNTSRVVNVLLGYKKYDEDSHLNEVETIEESIQQTAVKIIMAPGTMDYRIDKTTEQLCEQIKASTHGQSYDIIMIAGSYPFKWTDEEQKLYNFTKELFSKHMLKNKGVLTLTNFASNSDIEGSAQLQFENYMSRNLASDDKSLVDFLSLFSERKAWICLDSLGDRDNMNGEQIEKLLNNFKHQKQMDKSTSNSDNIVDGVWPRWCFCCCNFFPFSKRKDYNCLP